MNCKPYSKPGTVLPVLIGILTGSVLFFLGDRDDAPGLCLIGLVLGFGLVFFGFHKMNKKFRINVTAPLFFGITGITGVLALFFDGEFGDSPGLFLIGGIVLCVGLMLIGIFNINKIRED
ncbi:MAG: hypothetical protein LBD29_05435 [Treponema sp.]|jgi:hypothetical protein|nr:hypothetical protein [Treponema sp.]